jgi:hypothetical protein
MSYSIDTTQFVDKALNFGQINAVRYNLDNPTTIQDKLMWLNIYDTDPLKTKCADKILLHEHCKDILGTDLCIPIIAIYNNAGEIKFDELPDSFVIKCNHGSGMNIIVRDKAKIDQVHTRATLNKWLNTNFAFQNGFESHYNDIQRRIFVEQYMTDGHGDSLHDYKFWCFNGEPKIYTINSGNGHGDIMYYNMNDEEMNLYGVPHHDEYKKPRTFDKMVEYARKLSKQFKFVRVDFYEIDGKIYLGELTFTPGACVFKYKNPADNIKIGKMLAL